MELRFGEHIPGLTVDGKELRARVFNEREVRAAAGLTMVIGAIAFSYAYFTKQYVPLQVVASLFFVEFLTRLAAGIRCSPIGVISRALTAGQPPEWVSAKPKRFAWTLGMSMALAMTVITTSGIRGYLPRTICLICLTPDVDGVSTRRMPGVQDLRRARQAGLADRRPRGRDLRRRRLRPESVEDRDVALVADPAGLGVGEPE